MKLKSILSIFASAAVLSTAVPYDNTSVYYVLVLLFLLVGLEFGNSIKTFTGI